jgi:hypothetical protein
MHSEGLLVRREVPASARGVRVPAVFTAPVCDTNQSGAERHQLVPKVPADRWCGEFEACLRDPADSPAH